MSEFTDKLMNRARELDSRPGLSSSSAPSGSSGGSDSFSERLLSRARELDRKVTPSYTWQGHEQAERDFDAWAPRIEEMDTSLANREKILNGYVERLQALQEEPYSQSNAYKHRAMYDNYEKALREYNDMVRERNALSGRMGSALEQYRSWSGGQDAQAETYRQEAAALDERNAELDREMRNYALVNTPFGLENAGPYQAMQEEYDANAARAAELRRMADEAQWQYYGGLRLNEDWDEHQNVLTVAEMADRGYITESPYYDGSIVYEYINDINNRRDMMHGYDASGTRYEAYSKMTPDEIAVYNYIYSAQGPEAAETYLSRLRNELNTRLGTEKYEEMGGLGKALYWIPAGFDRFAQGLRQLGQEEAVPVTPMTVTSSLIQQEAQETSPVLGGLYDLGANITNMVPSLLASVLTGGAFGAAAGSALLGASAGGNTYADVMRDPERQYSAQQARDYATLVGVSEGALSYLLGGISRLGGVSTRQVLTKLGGLDNALGRIARSSAAPYVMSMISEGTEEGLQELLEPAFATLILGTEYDANFGDAAYAFLLGALTAGIVEGAEIGVSGVYNAATRRSNPAQVSFADMENYLGEDGRDWFEGTADRAALDQRFQELAESKKGESLSDAAWENITKQYNMARAFLDGRETAQNVRSGGAGQAVTSAPTAPQTVTEVETLLSSGNVSNSVAERIINTPELRAQFEALTGQQLTGTKSEMRNTIKEFARQRAADAAVERFEADVAEMNGEGVTQTPQAANVSEIPNSSPVQGVNTPVTPDSSVVNPESSVGDMARGATVGHTPTYAENQEHALEGALGEQYEGPGVHEVLPNQDSMFYAQQRLDADYEGEVSDLRSKQEWDAIDTDAGFLILQQLSQKAMESNSETDISALRDWSNLVRSRATTAGQTLQAYSKWRQFTPESAYADAVDILYGDNVRRGMTEKQKQTILQETKEASEQLESIAPEDTASTIELIKRLSQQRRTTGLLRNDTSGVMNMALQQVAQQEGGAEFLRNVAQAQIRNLAIDYERVSFTERMRTLRALNLLSKPATTLRNLIGNFVFDPLESISNNTGVALDWLLSQYTGQRTTALDKSWFSEAKRRGSVDALARSIIEVGLDADTSGVTNRYEQGGGRTFRMTGNFIERLLSTWEKYNGYALTSTDEFAKGGTRAEAERGLRDLADRGLLVDAQEAQAEQRQRGRNILAPGTVVRALDRNNFGHVVAYDPANDTYLVHFESREGATADVELPASQVVDTKAAGRARRRLTGSRDSGAAQRAQLSTDDYITQRAEEIAKQRTFQNDSIASDVMLGLRDVGNILHVGDIGVGDVTVPFARVPANVATQAINYSPAGLSNGTVQIARVLRAARNGTLTPQQQAAAVMSLGRGLAGTTGIALFAGLALKGILNVAGADDDDERAFDTGEGLSGTQLNLSALERWINGESTEWQDGDTLLNIGFLEPINAQMAMGSMIADSYLEDGTLSARDMLNASIEGTMQSVIDLPAMSSIQELLDAWQYASGDDITERALNAAMSYAGSQATSFVVPNMVAGIAAGLDNTVRAPYVGETPLEDMLYQFMNDIPGLRENVPERLDSWGNERQYTDNDVLNFLNNTILPGSVTQYQSSAVNQELRRLGADAMPRSSAPSDFSIDGEKIVLTQEQKDAYQKAYGEAALSSLDGLIESETYQSLSDADKLKVVESVYDYANAIAKQSIDSRYELEGAPAKAAEYDNPGEYFMFNEALKNIEDSKGADTAAFDAVMEDYANMDASEQNALMEMLGENTRFDDVVEAFEAGISPEEWYDAYDKYKELDANGNLSANDAATEFAKWLDTDTDFTNREQDVLEEQFIFWTMISGDTERYDMLINHGFTPEQALNLYDEIGTMNTYTSDGVSGGKKAKVVAHINRLNISQADKDWLYLDVMGYSKSGLDETPWHQR